ncbi:restriction endonuclease subunit S [Vibrio parahaemolyticus]|uniref:restriction endonuclease subunit S n=1 Tax=Vibrio parahaemolyticus TaxID=670 RepID=UPI000F4D688F|nr:restriction endonuclease subunit S [Vibrio parahaemolyticus]RPB33404.1 restriction endonuclease subunit S [Vibrio parahaemolyticus]
MTCNWPEISLADIYDIRSGLSKPASAFGSGFPFLSFKEVFGNYFVPEELSQLVESSEKERANGSIKRGDVFLTRTSETMHELGMSSVALKDYKNATFNGFTKRLRPKEGAPHEVHPEFVGYYFRSPRFRTNMLAFSTLSTRASLNNDMITRLTLPLPPIDIQKKIAKILKCLDDKVSVNSKMNQTLEEMAQAIFKSWFVDFDPVKAKMNGQLPEGMDEATASLFPEKLVESELGLIPEGWEVLPSEKVATVAIGKTPPRKEPQWFSEDSKDVTWISIRDMGNTGTYALNSSEYLTQEAVDKFNVKVIPDNTLILSFKLTVGRVAITHGEMTTNEAIAHYKLSDNARVSTNYLYSYMKQFNFESLGSTSSIAKAVNSKIIKALPVIVPSKEILGSFDTLVKPLFDKIKSNQMENQNLEALRDTLLPKLLSGEIELDVAEAITND